MQTCGTAGSLGGSNRSDWRRHPGWLAWLGWGAWLGVWGWLAGGTAAQAQCRPYPEEAFWLVDGPVSAMVVTNGAVYLGGEFTYVGPRNRSVARLENSATGRERALKFPRVEGVVYAVVPDGSGGWLLGGQFAEVGGVAKTNLARVGAGGELDTSWDAAVVGTAVRAMARVGDRLWLGGQFTRIGGEARRGLARVEVESGAVDSWNPGLAGSVYAMAVGDGVVYVGGSFTAAGGVARDSLAAFDSTTGQVTGWKPEADRNVLALVAVPGVVYAGGDFATAGGKPRNRLAALDAGTGQATAWNPNPNGTVRALWATESTVYVGGDFTTISVRNRRGFAALARGDGAALALDLGIEGSGTPQNLVQAVARVGDEIWVGGGFARAQGGWRPLVAAVEPGAAEVRTMPRTTMFNGTADNAIVYCIGTEGGQAVLGGSFESMGGVARTNAAALSLVDGGVMEWAPRPSAPVQVMAAAGSRVWLGGAFTRVGEVECAGLAAVDGVTGGLDPAWLFTASNHLGAPVIRALVVERERLWVGGQFDGVGGVVQRMLAAVDAETGAREAWTANVKGGTAGIEALAVAGDVLVAAGDFTSLGGQARTRLAAVQSADGQATAWVSAPNQAVESLVVAGDRLYVGGSFTKIGGVTLRNLAVFGIPEFALMPWDGSLDTGASGVRALAAHETALYLAGDFAAVGGEFRDRVASVSPGTAQAAAWNPAPNVIPTTVVVAESWVGLGGAFRTVAGDGGRRAVAYFALYAREPWIREARVAGGRLTMRSTTGDRRLAVLQGSTDLVAWRDWRTNDVTGAEWVIEESAEASPYGFFRVVAR